MEQGVVDAMLGGDDVEGRPGEAELKQTKQDYGRALEPAGS